jgi:D-lactate dehydrogenase (quinone)
MNKSVLPSLISQLQSICGTRHVLTSTAATRRYRKGYRTGEGPVLAVVRPGRLLELWRVLQACVAADVIIILQAANTGLTGGSAPDGVYDRPVVLINTLRLSAIHLLPGAQQVVCLPGATLYELEDMLRPHGREPHSVIGSSCLGASVLGGICNNSGGALVQRGPAYTELSLYAQINAVGQLELVNHLGIDLGTSPEAILTRLEAGEFCEINHGCGAACAQDYPQRVRAISAPTPARFNADVTRLHEASGCAGKLAVFAVRLDTFPSAGPSTLFYLGTNNAAHLTALRRALLAPELSLPISAEYLHRGAFAIAAQYGKDTFLAITHLGTRFLPKLFAAKNWVDACAERLGLRCASDFVLQGLAKLFPQHLPARLLDYHARYEHHLLLQVAQTQEPVFRKTLEAFAHSHPGIEFFMCTADEARRAQLHRFVAAGAAIRYENLHHKQVAGLLALDIALRRNDEAWFEQLPAPLEAAIAARLYYGHFLCHVFHQDYIVRDGYDPEGIKAQMLALLDARGAEYPAEHNVGHFYEAKPALASFYRTLDPTNSVNPGLGKTSKRKGWG